MDSLYLGPERSGVGWLLDPASPEVAALGRAAKARQPETPCDPGAVAADLDALPGLIRERHFGVATGRAGAPDEVIAAARDRILAERPDTWGGAVGDLAGQLRARLGDRHFGIAGADGGAVPAGQDGPAVQVTEHEDVLCVRIRRFFGDPGDDRLLREWSQRGLEHFGSSRIVVDLRGNPGGDDGFLYRWIRPVRSADAQIPGAETGWYVGEVPLGLWNPSALIEATDGLDAVPAYHREHRHRPGPADVLDIREDQGEAVPAGERPWHGRMLVVVDRQTFSSGESSAWALRHALGAVLIGTRTGGMLEYGNNAPYLLPASGMLVRLASKHNDLGISIEFSGLPVDVEVDPATPLAELASSFDRLYQKAS
jgi:hypothetical protein